jgi:perosamine synthetase
MSLIVNNISQLLCKFYKYKKIYLHEPFLDKKDFSSLKNCFQSRFISTAGAEVRLFERKISEITKSKHAIAVLNGTIGLYASLKSINIKQDDEVIVPAITFVATANAVSHCGAIPHFVDITLADYGIDPIKLDLYLKKITIIRNNKCFNTKTKKYIKAIIPVHIFGNPSQITDILQVAKKYKLTVIEDATEALGSYFNNRHVGTFGKIGVFSFNGNKIITTGGGGAIVTNDNKLAKKIRHLCSTAKVSHSYKFIHDQVAYNFKMPAINASLGCSQILKLKKLIKKKKKLNLQYQKLFSKTQGVKIYKPQKNVNSNYWLQTLILEKKNKNFKDKIILECLKNGIQVRPLWEIIASLKMYKKCPSMNLKNSRFAYNTVISLPSGVKL